MFKSFNAVAVLFVWGISLMNTGVTTELLAAENAPKKRSVAIFLYPGVEVLDFSGPAEVFAATDDGKAFNVFTVAAAAEPIISQGFLKVVPQYTIKDCPAPDILVIPGGSVRSSVNNPDVVEWVKTSSEKSEVVLSVCTGVFLAGKAGLLEGQAATTHWAFIDRLKAAHPGTTVKENVRFVDNGKVVTAAGVSAGIDGALHVVKRLHGPEEARKTARYMEYRYEE
jgi:transcriptional regulator GlxA family with amidase domain